MANLFFIHTPLQLLVAQQIIHQCNLVNNIMLYGYVGNNRQFFDIYNLTTIDGMWSKKIRFDNISTWAEFHQIKYFIQDAYHTFQNYRKLKSIIRSNDVDAVYLSDINNESYKLTAVLQKRNKLKICFFEDGTSHYHFSPNPYVIDSTKNRIISHMMDIFYFIPVFGLKWGRVLRSVDLPFDQIPVDTRYSLIPFYHESYDVLIHYTSLISQDLKKYIQDDIDGFDTEKSILFLTQPVYEAICAEKTEYLEIVDRYMKSLTTDHVIFLKFHPREKESTRKKITEIINNNSIPYKIIAEKINVPVEYYLQYVKFKEIVTFFTSTAYYNGYLFPYTKFVYLIEPYYDLCKMRNKKFVSRLDEALDMVKKLQKKN